MKSSHTTDLILAIVDDLENSEEERIKLSEKRGSVLNHSEIARVFISPGKRRNAISLLFTQSGLLSALARLLRYILLAL